MLYASVIVESGGVLENAKLELTDTNFELQENEQGLNIGTLKAGEQKTLELPIQIKKVGNVFNLGLLDMISKITLTGNYTNEDDTININTAKYVQVNWTSEAIDEIAEEDPKPIELTQDLITYKKYNIGGIEKRIIQYKITSGIADNKYPIKSTVIELQVPKVDGSAPEEVVVAAYSLNATNPNEILNFKEYDETYQNNAYYTYNQLEEKVNINIANKEDQNNEVVWNKQGQDEFVVTYIYPADVEITTIESIANSKITLHDRVLSKEITNKQTITQETENFGSVAKIESAITPSIYKGNMYIGKDTNYQTTSKIYIPYSKIPNDIVIEETESTLPEGIATYYKTTKINKADALKVLGTQGTIVIYDGETKKSIDLSQEVEEDYYTISYESNESKLEIVLTPAQSEGTIEIINEKVIKIIDVSKVSAATELKLHTILTTRDTENRILDIINLENAVNLLEPVSDAEFGISKTEFSTTQENDVNFTITLKTDNLKYDLYEAPIVTITLPEIVKDIKVTEEDITILNSDEIKLETLDVDNENNQIKLTLSGKQTGYSSTNAQISINAKISTQKLIPTTTQNIVMTLLNGKETIYPNNAEAIISSQAVNFEAESGILLATSVSNYNSENKTITAFEENITGILETEKEAKIATVEGIVINNTKSNLEEIKILGKVQNSGTSISTALNTQVEVVNVFGENPNLETVVYYTEDTNPSLESNWVDTPNANTTAYLAVCKNLNKATAIKFTYKIVIPENLDTNKNTEINYEIYASNQTYVAPEVKLQTPKEVKLDLELTANVQEGQEVYEGQNIVYNIKVTNSGEVDAENVKIDATLAGLNIVEGQTVIEGLNIKAGDTVEKQIKAIVKEDATTITFVAQANTEYLIEEAKETITNTVGKAGVKLEIDERISTFSEYVGIAQIGSKINYQLRIANTLEEDLNNIEIIDILPEELKFEELYVYKKVGEELTALDLTQIENSYNEETKELKIKVDNLKPEEQILVSIYTNVEKVVDSNIINIPNVMASEKYQNVTFSVTSDIKVIGLPIITSSVTSNAKESINAGDIIEYTIKVKNEGETTEFITIESIIPEQLDVQSAYYYYTEGEQKEAAVNFNIIKLYSMELKQNQELTVKITAKANEITSDTEVESRVTIKGIYEYQITDKIENTIIGTGENPSDNPSQNPDEDPNDNPNQNPGENPNDNPDGESGNQGENQESTYSISGVAWQDDNKNGARENEEKLLSGIVVKILNAETNEYLPDEQTTNENGVYEFVGLKPGKYILIYEYNKTTYSPAVYQKSEVESTLNSDARLVTEGNNNITKTDILEITNENISNIDIGLIINPIFDLKLDKYITKATVQNSQETKIYEYDKTQLAKIEIPAKVLEGSLIIVEYQIDVTNEGDIPAHVDTIVDYVSPQFEFKSELNTAWYQGNDNNLYCIEFANEDLEPGKTISTKLVLTKTMTSNNTGLVNNAAEIYETFNEYAFEDIDSIPANKGEEDDLSEADIIISIKTGGPLLYIGIVIMVMAILSAGIYLINKKVIKNYII